MVSSTHEGLVELARAALASFVRATAGGALRGGIDPSGARLADPTLPQLVPPSRMCDLVLEVASRRPGRPDQPGAIIV